MEFDSTKFGERIRKKRLALNITQAQLAERIGTSVGYIGHMERGLRSPSLDILVELCQALHTTPNFLLQDYVDVSTEGVDALLSPEMIHAAKLFISTYEHLKSNY